jgi:hypothetical protein
MFRRIAFVLGTISSMALAAEKPLPPAVSRQMMAAFGPGDAPSTIQLLGSVADGKAMLVFACGTGSNPRALVARFEADGAMGDLLRVGDPISTCGTVTVSPRFNVKWPGAPPRAAVLATWSNGSKPVITAAITLEPRVLAWTTAEPPPGGAPIVPLSRRAGSVTSFCVRESDGSWDTIAWQEAIGEWEAGDGPCTPPPAK